MTHFSLPSIFMITHINLNFYINSKEKNLLETFVYCSEKTALCSSVYTHTKKRFTIYTQKYLVLSVTKALFSLSIAKSRIPLECAWSLLPATAVLSRSSTKVARAGSPAAQRQVTGWCLPWAQSFSPLDGYHDHKALVEQNVSALLLQGQVGVGCVTQTLDQLFWQPSDHPAQWGLWLITSGHNRVQQHQVTFFSCVSWPYSGSRKHFIDVWLWCPFPATQGKKTVCKGSGEVLQNT